MLEAEADEARSKDLKMQVTANKEIISIEKSTTNLDLARDCATEICIVCALSMKNGLFGKGLCLFDDCFCKICVNVLFLFRCYSTKSASNSAQIVSTTRVGFNYNQ